MNADEVVEKVLPLGIMHSWEPAIRECREQLKQAILSGVLVPQKDKVCEKCGCTTEGRFSKCYCESKPKRPVSRIAPLNEVTDEVRQSFMKTNPTSIMMWDKINELVKVVNEIKTPNPS